MTEHLTDALLALNARDKANAARSLAAAAAHLPPGPCPARFHLRAADCSADISNWGVAAHHTRQALAAVHEARLSA